MRFIGKLIYTWRETNKRMVPSHAYKTSLCVEWWLTFLLMGFVIMTRVSSKSTLRTRVLTNTFIFGILWYIYSLVVRIIFMCWSYGQVLRSWGYQVHTPEYIFRTNQTSPWRGGYKCNLQVYRKVCVCDENSPRLRYCSFDYEEIYSELSWYYDAILVVVRSRLSATRLYSSEVVFAILVASFFSMRGQVRLTNKI
jgi:hypothetical protein